MNVKCLSDVVLSIYVIESGRISARMEIPPSLREPALVCDNSHWEKKKKKVYLYQARIPCVSVLSVATSLFTVLL